MNQDSVRSSSTSLTIGGNEERDLEAATQPQLSVEDVSLKAPQEHHHSYWSLLVDKFEITDAVRNHNYHGSGTDADPYVVEFLQNDPRNALQFPEWKKWAITVLAAFQALAVSFASSAYSGGAPQIVSEFGVSEELVVLGLAIFVLGFAIGPLIWAPMSEMYGRQIVFCGTYALLAVFSAGTAGAQNIETIIILRFFAGAFGSSPLTNAGGIIADIFPADQRGLAMSVFAVAPFLGPSLGPIVGGFVGQTVGWRWVEGVTAIFTGVFWVVCLLTIPETYSPVILRGRAMKLSEQTGKVYRTRMDIRSGPKTVKAELKTALSRPWILLIKEPIVLLLSIYMAIVYGTLYMMFGAFPIVFQRERGWSQGIGGLAFCGIAVGMVLAVLGTIPDNKRYKRVSAQNNGFAPPEARLPPAILGSVLLPIGLFWFAWTNGPEIHWIVSIIGSAPFGFGMVLVFLSIMNYLIDAYTMYAASVLAANSVLRSIFGAVFPLFTSYMYEGLGIHWASSIPAFLAVLCMPFPLLFYIYGARIRKKCKFAAIAAQAMDDAKAEESARRKEKADGEKEGEAGVVTTGGGVQS